MRIILPLICLLTVVSSCDNTDGLFGHSKSKQEAKANGSSIAEYFPNKSTFKLLDGTEMKIDTAWTEVSFTYKNGNRILDSSYGYHFSIPVENDSLENFTFTLSLADKTNQMFTNPGPGKEGLCQLCPKSLFDNMKVLLEQKNTDTSKGWLNPIITDTIIFIRIKAS
ncbi:MAG: hypothetical protein JNK14_14810 [Chitinophagaceae bacterium]|nr:hypothetical protein [Chitinophagaceae bacterium]